MSIFFITILGLFIGSFLNVLADRWSAEETIGGRSHCEFCKHTLSPLDLIPLISFLELKGKCRYCRKKLSFYYPLVELVTGVVFGMLVFVIPAKAEIYLNGSPIELGMTYISYFGVISSLIVIFFADLKYHIIPDQAVIGVVLFSLPIIFFTNILPYSIFGGIIITAIIYTIYFITRGRGMGFGDVKYAFAMGFLLGVVKGLVGLYIAFIGGAIVSIVAILLKKRGMASKIAFGPFLVFGTVVMLFWPEKMILLLKAILGFT